MAVLAAPSFLMLEASKRLVAKRVSENKENRPHDVGNTEHLNTLPDCAVTWPILSVVVQQINWFH